MVLFFCQNLGKQESYGSGIRRTKDALKENRSPELQFLPDNDIDDYTMAVVMINEEFAAIREEEQKDSDVTIPAYFKRTGEKEFHVWYEELITRKYWDGVVGLKLYMETKLCI